MSRLNEITTQAFADDENSDIDENLKTYQPALYHKQNKASDVYYC